MNEYIYLIKELQSPEFAPLSIDEERALLKKALDGDFTAKTIIVKSSFRFLYKMASNYYSEKLSILDLIQNGALGLWSAFEGLNIGKLNPNQRFLSYGRIIAQQYMLDAIRKSQEIVVKKHVFFNKKIKKITCLSLQSPMQKKNEEDKERFIEDLLESGENIEEDFIKSAEITKLKEQLEKLPEAEKELIKKIYYEGIRCNEIAKEEGVSREAIHQRRKKILNKLKKLLD